jgi:dienelactone hydrolase
MLKRMPRPPLGIVLLLLAMSGCATTDRVTFENATPGHPRTIPAVERRPDGSGPFPAVVLLHGCHGVSPSTLDWAAWFRDRGYVALVVDSWAARRVTKGCTPASPEVPNTERFDDAIGALRYLQSRPYVKRDAIGAIGWSNGGVFAIAVVNGPSHERARKRGVTVPAPGFRAAIGVYPGGCYSLVHEQVVRPLLVLIGDADDWTIPGPCVAMVTAMRSRGADATVVLYPGAVHYFDVEGQPRTQLTDVENRNLPGECCGATVGYDAVAAADAHRRVEAFFARHLKAQ